MLLQACIDAGFARIIVVAPNNDPGSEGIIRAIMRARSPLISTYQNLARGAFLGLMRDAALLIGNSSSGIIEAASFGTPVVDIGPRQAGRERGPNVISVPFERSAIRRALKRLWNQGNPRRFPRNNIYGAGNTARRIASALAAVPLDGKIRRKLIAY
jgi:UDP-N-acetylglucosamine 2-epimerase